MRENLLTKKEAQAIGGFLVPGGVVDLLLGLYVEMKHLVLISHYYDLFKSPSQGNEQTSNANEYIQWELVYLDT